MGISLLPEEYKQKEAEEKKRAARQAPAADFAMHLPEERPHAVKTSVTAEKLPKPDKKPSVELKQAVFEPAVIAMPARGKRVIARPEQTVSLPPAGDGAWTRKQKIIVYSLLIIVVIAAVGAWALRGLAAEQGVAAQNAQKANAVVREQLADWQNREKSAAAVSADLRVLRPLKREVSLLPNALRTIDEAVVGVEFTDVLSYDSAGLLISGRGAYAAIYTLIELLRKTPLFSSVSLDEDTQRDLEEHLILTKGGLPEDEATGEVVAFILTVAIKHGEE